MNTPDGVKSVRAALLCTASDIPATRKLGGFVGHGSLKGCSRCLKNFPTAHFGEKPDYRGFDRSCWPKRCLGDHKLQGMNWKHANTLKKRQDIEHEYGVRFTELLRLPYFDSIRYAIVDPMHNVLLGSAKHMMILWKENKIVTEALFAIIQEVVDKYVTPVGLGRIPHKIASGFSAFTADQWKNWTLVYSLIALKDVLPDHHYQCWHTFVLACNLMCSRAISHASVSQMDEYLIQFCKRVEQLFGINGCTPNLHLHGHLHECFLDYGPSDSFWLFSFERLNGILGSVCTNNHAIEIQLMRKFVSMQQIFHRLNSGIVDDELRELLESTTKGSLRSHELREIPLLQPLSLNNVGHDACKLLPAVKQNCLQPGEVRCINDLMRIHFEESFVKTLLIYDYSRAAMFNDEVYGSINSQHANSSLVCVRIRHNANGQSTRPGFVVKYMKVNVIVKSSFQDRETSILVNVAAIHYLDERPNKEWFGTPTEVWQKAVNCSEINAYVTLRDIMCRCAYVTKQVRFGLQLVENITAVVPIYYFAGLI